MIMRVLPSVYVGLSILSVFYNFIILAADEFARIMSMSFCNTFLFNQILDSVFFVRLYAKILWNYPECHEGLYFFIRMMIIK